MIYFDHNATTPLCEPAREAWLRASRDHWYNASSLYRVAAMTAQRLDAARERLAEKLGCDAERIIFTSGATEANNALLAKFASEPVAFSAIEHPSVREAAPASAYQLPVDENGIAILDGVERFKLVSVMAANNESGVLQPWQKFAKVCQQHGVAFHTDATQWIGKLDSTALGACDYITGSAHKFGGPKGVGFLVLRDESEALRFLRGGPQENGRRAGTENYPGIEAMVTALEWASSLMAKASVQQVQLCDQFVAEMKRLMPEVRVVNERAPRLWNTVMLVMPRHDNRKWLARLSQLGFAISTGSACSSGREGSSVVLQALGATAEELKRTIRVSSGWETTDEEWANLAAALAEVGAGFGS